jgi:hypothetical protein
MHNADRMQTIYGYRLQTGLAMFACLPSVCPICTESAPTWYVPFWHRLGIGNVRTQVVPI